MIDSFVANGLSLIAIKSMKRIEVKKGDRYGKLVVVKEVHKNFESSSGKNIRMVLCRCDCGNEKEVRLNSIRTGHTKSCGCLKSCLKIGLLKKHGMKPDPIYACWRDMKQRCFNKNHKNYNIYGGRGITVCKRWMKFENFYKDMGKRPKKKSIDRIDTNGNYCFKNCKWSTSLEQNRNRRNNVNLTYKGETKIIAEWARTIGVTRAAITARLKLGWSVEKAVSTKSKGN